MFGKKRKAVDCSGLAGVVTFYGSHHALKADKVLKDTAKPSVLIPGPRDISPNCGVALRFDYEDREGVRTLFEAHHVHYEAIHHYPA